MEIREFAERVLYGKTLTDKLTPPGRLSDDKPGAACLKTPLPARPSSLSFSSPDRARESFPKSSDLHLAGARGKALHFFANHELLALELMALALLRFPEAPSSFRKRLVATMRDEQVHMSLYLERMGELGCELGSVPLNSFFWDLISPMTRPMDFVAAMSLTFEQANLDFSLHYRDAFSSVGDDKTARIMERVLRDEVAHVRHGVRFFETWKKPSMSQWEAYQDALVYPLTPARAKGIGFTVAHREAAGLEPDFIDRLRVYSHSKGRPPRVLMFNPDTEVALARRAKGHTPPAGVVAMTRDLETLPLFVMAQEDVLLVRDEPRPEWLAGLQERGYSTPECVTVDLEARRFPAKHALMQRRISALDPWGWDPKSAEFLQPLTSQLKGAPKSLDDIVQKRAHLGSKSWLAKRIPEMLNALSGERRAHFITNPLPQVVETRDELESVLEALRSAGFPLIVAKAPHGSAGRGAQRLELDGPNIRQEGWLRDTLSKQGSLSVEPWYERVIDLSYLFKIQPSGALSEVGFNPFFTDATGRYRGAILGNLKLAFDDEINTFVHRATADPQWLWRSIRALAKTLVQPMKEAGFTGPAGIDFMLVRDHEGCLKVRAPLELNPRCTMGHIAKAIAHPLGSRSSGLWVLLNKGDLAKTTFKDFASLFASLAERLPTRLYPGTKKALRSGVLATNDPARATHILGIALIAERFDDALQHLIDCGVANPLARPHLKVR